MRFLLNELKSKHESMDYEPIPLRLSISDPIEKSDDFDEPPPVLLTKKRSVILRKIESSIKEEPIEECLQCSICKDPFLPIDIDLECHSFHGECLSSYVVDNVNSKTYPILCPADSCDTEIHPNELRMCLNEDTFKACEDLSVEHFMKSQRAELKTCPLCKETFEAFEGVDKVVCPICRENICLSCMSLYHDGKTCDEYQKHIQNTFKCSGCGNNLKKSVGSKVVFCNCGYMKVSS